MKHVRSIRKKKAGDFKEKLSNIFRKLSLHNRKIKNFRS